MKKTLDSLDGRAIEGMRALVRVDFNVPIHDGTVGDDTRIAAALPTINWLRTRGARVILLSHLGRPKSAPDPALSLRPVADRLERLLGQPVTFLPDPLDDATVQATKRMKRGEVAVVENTRFWPGETANDLVFTEQLARLGDLFVNDAFGAVHRAHASTEGLAHLLKPAVAGFLVAKELEFLERILDNPTPPVVAVLGGAKISGKIDVIESLLPKVDEILIGGAMACTFFLAQGHEVGNSLVEPDRVEMARDLLQRAGSKLVLPSGATIAKNPDSRDTKVVAPGGIPAGFAMYDIDPGTARDFAKRIEAAKTVVWNGPMGVFETPPFDEGTLAIAEAIAHATENGATTLVGGGDSAAAIVGAGLEDDVTHVSTGGGASLEFLEGKQLPGITALDDA